MTTTIYTPTASTLAAGLSGRFMTGLGPFPRATWVTFLSPADVQNCCWNTCPQDVFGGRSSYRPTWSIRTMRSAWVAICWWFVTETWRTRCSEYAASTTADNCWTTARLTAHRGHPISPWLTVVKSTSPSRIPNKSCPSIYTPWRWLTASLSREITDFGRRTDSSSATACCTWPETGLSKSLKITSLELALQSVRRTWKFHTDHHKSSPSDSLVFVLYWQRFLI